MGTFPPLELVSMKRLLGFGPALSSASARAALASRGSHTSWFAWQIELDCTYFGTPNNEPFPNSWDLHIPGRPRWKLKLLDQLIPSGNPTWQT
jgi:hypothetical protein